MAGPGGRASEAGDGRLSRPGALHHVPVLPGRHTDRHASGGRALRVRDHQSGQAADVQDRHLHRSRLSRPAGADAVPEERHLQAPALDQARVSGCARPAADLHRIRHVGRGRLPQGVQRNRLAIGGAVGGICADHGRIVLPAGPQDGLREPGEPRRARRGEIGMPGLAAIRTLRHAARPEPCA